MAGINPDLGSLKLQNLQFSKTTEVDSQKAEDKEVGDAQTSAVWNSGKRNEASWKDGDVVVARGFLGIKKYYRVSIDPNNGDRSLDPIRRKELENQDFEYGRGNYCQSDFLNGNY